MALRRAIWRRSSADKSGCGPRDQQTDAGAAQHHWRTPPRINRLPLDIDQAVGTWHLEADPEVRIPQRYSKDALQFLQRHLTGAGVAHEGVDGGVGGAAQRVETAIHRALDAGAQRR